MLEKPDLTDDVIIKILRDHFDTQTVELEFLPIGNDSLSWVYRVDADDDAAYFLKARGGEPYPPSLLVPRALYNSGIGHVVAPIPTISRTLSVRVGNYSLILYPFIEGRSAWDVDLSEAQWVEIGATVRRIHRAVLPPRIAEQVMLDTFISPATDTARRVQAAIEGGGQDEIGADAAAFWNERRGEIETMGEHVLMLGQRLAADPPPFVLCHTDIHTANIMVGTDEVLYIVDWDMPMYSPRERDLMFVEWRDGVEAFYRGYGEVEINLLAMAYFKAERALADVTEFAAQVFLTPGAGDETRTGAARWLRQMFEPGSMMDIAWKALKQEF